MTPVVNSSRNSSLRQSGRYKVATELFHISSHPRQPIELCVRQHVLLPSAFGSVNSLGELLTRSRGEGRNHEQFQAQADKLQRKGAKLMTQRPIEQRPIVIEQRLVEQRPLGMEQRPVIEQRPISGFGSLRREIEVATGRLSSSPQPTQIPQLESCTSGMMALCETRYRKTMASFCQCGEGWHCCPIFDPPLDIGLCPRSGVPRPPPVGALGEGRALPPRWLRGALPETAPHCTHFACICPSLLLSHAGI